MKTPVLFEKQFSQGLFRVYDGDPHFENLRFSIQTHSNIVVDFKTPELSTTIADGISGFWGEVEGESLAVKTADCLPILLIGEKGVAVVHAGWKGLATQILAAPLLKQIEPFSAFIGPCIHSCCFEVTSEFRQHFPDSPFIESEGGQLRFNLIQEAEKQLKVLYTELKFEDSGQCTYCESKYSSFRRDKTTRRIWNCFHPLAK